MSIFRRRRKPLSWVVLAPIFVVSMVIKGMASGFSLASTLISIVLSLIVIGLIFGLAYVVEKRLLEK